MEEGSDSELVSFNFKSELLQFVVTFKIVSYMVINKCLFQ